MGHIHTTATHWDAPVLDFAAVLGAIGTAHKREVDLFNRVKELEGELSHLRALYAALEDERDLLKNALEKEVADVS